MISVTLTFPEMMLAAQVAAMRRVQGMKHNRAKTYGYGFDSDPLWQTDAISCLAEMALAKQLDRFWSGTVGDITAADVGTFYQVRATEHPTGRLILHPKDKDEQPFVLARVAGSRVDLMGWVYGRDGKLQNFWEALRPMRFAFVVPTELLHDMTTLPDEFEGAA